MTTSTALDKAISITGNVNLLAKAVGVSHTAAQKWERKGFIPPTSILRVEKALKGRVTRYELIDDFFSKQGATHLETPHGTDSQNSTTGAVQCEPAPLTGAAAQAVFDDGGVLHETIGSKEN